MIRLRHGRRQEDRGGEKGEDVEKGGSDDKKSRSEVFLTDGAQEETDCKRGQEREEDRGQVFSPQKDGDAKGPGSHEDAGP